MPSVQRPAPAAKTNGVPNHESRDRRALRHLRRVDPQLGAIIRRVGPFRPTLTRNPFVALVGSIIHQQISMRAAASIQQRLRDLCPRGRLTPASIAALRDGKLRSVGLSRQKARYIAAVAEAFADGTLSAPRLRRMDDEQVIAATTALPGVGRWTAEMLLIFCLQRPDVWPADDLGLRTAARNFLGLAETPKRKEVEEWGERWRPYRTYACWYLWRSLKNELPPAIAAELD